MRGQGYDNMGSWVFRIIFLNIAVFFIQNMSELSSINFEVPFGQSSFVSQMPTITYYFGLIPAMVVTKFYIWQVVTYMFLHANFMHIFLNMYGLMLFGLPIEQLWGRKRFLVYYFFTGAGAGITILVMNLITGGTGLLVPTIGASGAVFGILLAFGILFPDVELLVFFFIPMKARYMVFLYGGIELMALISSGGSSNISHIGHLGGIIFGLIYFAVIRRRGIEFNAKKMKARLVREMKSRDEIIPGKTDSRDRLCAVLDKLKKGGSDSLTDDEYQFIKLHNIMHDDDNDLCIEEDFNYTDDYCRKCEHCETCLMREIKKYI